MNIVLKVAGILCVSISILGCSKENQTKEEAKLLFKQNKTIRLPVEVKPSRFAIIEKEKTIHLGGTASSVLENYTAPANSINIKTLPLSLKAPLKAKGWDAEKEALALIVQDDRTAMIMYTLRDVSEEQIEQAEDQYKKAFGEPIRNLPGIYSKYQFWQDANQRLMLLATLDSKKKWHLTFALGVIPIMNALRMNTKDAILDQEKAYKTLKDLFKEIRE